jgi:hypothetical protein
VTSPRIGPATQLTKNVISLLGNAPAQRSLTLLQTTNPYSSSGQTLGSSANWFKVTEALSYTDFATNATSYNLPLFILPGGGIVHGIKIIHSQAFVGGAISLYTLSVGIVGSPTLFTSTFSVSSTPASNNFKLSSNFYAFDDVNATTIIVQAVSTSANLNAAVSGVVEIYAYLSMAF